MDLIFPRGKDTVMNAFNHSVEKTEIPVVEDFYMVHYDEKFPKQGQTTEYLLTLLDHLTGRLIAENCMTGKILKPLNHFLNNI